MKTPTLVAFILSFFSLTVYASETYSVPPTCPPQNLQLRVVNLTSQTQQFVLKNLSTSESKNMESFARSETIIQGTELIPNGSAFQLKPQKPKTLEFKISCNEGPFQTLKPFTTPQRIHRLDFAAHLVSISLLNLYPEANKIRLLTLDKSGQIIDQKNLSLMKYYDTQKIDWQLSKEVTTIEIQSEQRLSSLVSTKKENKIFFAQTEVKAPISLPLDSSKKYFLVSTKTQAPTDSYVIALEDQNLITKAREQLATGSFEKIIVGRISLGHGNINRDFNSADKSPYSWSVSAVDSFADFAYIDCDGSPEIIEDNLIERMNEGGRICFWRYRVVRELTPAEVSTGVLSSH